MHAGRPLLDTTPDAALFVGRQGELDRLVRAVRAGRNALVVGDPGAGSTSVLHQLSRRIRRGEPAMRPRFCNAALIETPAQLVDALFAADAGRAPATGPYRGFADYQILPPAVVALVDNLSPGLARVTFGRLRDEIWAIPASWVLTCTSWQEAAFREPPADAFFDVVVSLDRLDAAAATELVRRRAGSLPAELPAGVVAGVVAAGKGNPRELIRLLGDAQAGRPPAAGSRIRLSRPAGLLLDELRSVGAASASDRDLQARMGWTRARLTQVFAELLRAGVVAAGQVHNGIGRPRTVYRVSQHEPTETADGAEGGA